MKIIYRPRQSGKTTDLIKLASKGRYKLIVCRDQRDVDRVWKLILDLKKKKVIKNTPPQPITYQEFLDGRYAMGRNIEAFLIDEAQELLKLLTPANIEAITLSHQEDYTNKKPIIGIDYGSKKGDFTAFTITATALSILENTGEAIIKINNKTYKLKEIK